jgi:hypothetical protein
VASGEFVGHIRLSDVTPTTTPWSWTFVHSHHGHRTLTHGYAATREAAMQAFTRSWHREIDEGTTVLEPLILRRPPRHGSRSSGLWNRVARRGVFSGHRSFLLFLGFLRDLGLLRDGGPVGIEAHDVGVMRRQMRAQRRTGEQHRRRSAPFARVDGLEPSNG